MNSIIVVLISGKVFIVFQILVILELSLILLCICVETGLKYLLRSPCVIVEDALFFEEVVHDSH